MRNLRNLMWFCVGLLMSVGLFYMPYAHAQAYAPGYGPTSVVGPYSEYPPKYNPYLPNPATGAPSAASVANATGVAATQSGSATVTLPNGVKLPVPVSQTANVSKAAIARAVIGCKGLIGAVSCTATAAAVLAELLDQPTGAGRYRRCPNGVLAFICEAAPGQAVYDQSQKIWTAAGTVCNVAVPCSMPQVEAEIMRIGFTGTAILSRSLSGGTMTYMVARPSGNYLYQATAVAAILPNADIVLTPSTDAAVEQSLQEKMDADYFANRRLYDALKRDQANSPSDFPAAADPVTNDTPVSVSAPPVTSPERDVSVTQSPKPDGSVDTTTVKEKTTVTPTTTGTTQGTVKTTYPSSTTTTTTTINNVTNISNSSSTVVNNAPVEAAPEPEPQDPCKGNPNRAGCALLGEPPAKEAIPSQDVPITMTPVVFASSASCPAPITYSLYGAKSVSYQPMCDLMMNLRPLFLALGSLTAAIVFMGGLRL